MDTFKLRCRRCRCVVLVSDDVVNTHGQPVKETSCSSISTSSVWFVSMENEELSWIRQAITQALWIKGKLNCPKCNSRLGSFDFVKSAHCPCGEQTLPGVYILRDRVDKMLLKQTLQQQHFSPRVARSGSPLINEAAVSPHVPCSHEYTEGGSVSGETESNTEGMLPQSCGPGGWLDESEDDPQGHVGCSGTAGLRGARRNLQLCVPGVGQCLTPSAVEMDRLFSSDLRGNSQTCADSRDPSGASRNQTNGSRTVIQQDCDQGVKIKYSRLGDRYSGISQEGSDGCCEQPKSLKKELRVRRRKRLRSKHREAGHVDEESLDRESQNRFRHLEEEQSSSDDSIIEETVLGEHECPVCLDVFLHPHVCHPCGHVFCETCLRHLAQESDNSTAFPCPMCRILIKSCRLDRDLTNTIKTNYPASYKLRRMTDSKYLSHRYPLPRSTGTSSPYTINERIVYAMGGNENIYTLMSRLWLKCFTFLGAVILVLLLLCVSLAL